MDIENFVYYQKGGKVMSVGYEVDCKLLNKDLSVPAGLFILNQSIQSNTKDMAQLFDNLDDENKVIQDDLYDKLLGLMTPKTFKKRSAKKGTFKKSSKRQTRRKGKILKSRRKTRTKRR